MTIETKVICDSCGKSLKADEAPDWYDIMLSLNVDNMNQTHLRSNPNSNFAHACSKECLLKLINTLTEKFKEKYKS